MKNQKVSIKELAIETGVSEPTLKRLRTQPNTNPTLDVLTRLALALSVSINELIQVSNERPVFYQGEPIELGEDISEFMILFTKKTFSFQGGSKAVFRKHKQGNSVTKYIINTHGELFEKISDEKWLFRDQTFSNYSVREDNIFASILKELYEVNYV